MLSNVSPAFRDYLTALESSEIVVIKISLRENGMRATRFKLAVGGAEDEDTAGMWKGDTSWYAMPDAEVTMPSYSAARSASQTQLAIPVVVSPGREIVRWMRGLNEYPQVTLEAVLESAPSVVEIGPIDLNVKAVSYDASAMLVNLTANNLFKESFQHVQFDPFYTPAMYL